MVNIPGFTYPVKEIYLEETIEMTRLVVLCYVIFFVYDRLG